MTRAGLGDQQRRGDGAEVGGGWGGGGCLVRVVEPLSAPFFGDTGRCVWSVRSLIIGYFLVTD
jgi:hypothetical protein